MEFKNFLQELADSKIVKVAGSYSRGTENENSDIDFQIKTPKECYLYGSIENPNKKIVKELLAKYGIKWNSTRTGYISTIGEKNDIPIQMEFYDNFYKNKTKLKEITIFGIKFLTH